MNRAVFTNDVVVTYLDPGVRFFPETDILRRSAYYCAVSDPVAAPDDYFSLDDSVSTDDRVVSKRHPAVDQRVWTNVDIGADFCAGPDDRRQMNHQSTPASLKLKYGARPSAGAPIIT